MGKWPSISEFARDIGIKPTHATAMKTRGTINPDHFPAIVAAAKQRRISGVTLETLHEMRAATLQGQGAAA